MKFEPSSSYRDYYSYISLSLFLQLIKTLQRNKRINILAYFWIKNVPLHGWKSQLCNHDNEWPALNNVMYIHDT